MNGDTTSGGNKTLWSIELTADYAHTFRDKQHNRFHFSISGTGMMTVDWGDGTVSEHVPLVAISKGESIYSGKKYNFWHTYDRTGVYSVRIAGEGEEGMIEKFVCRNDLWTLFAPERLREANFYTALKLNGCVGLQSLECGDNQFETLDLSECLELNVLECDNNMLSSLDVSRNTQLKSLNCSDNLLLVLDVGKNVELESLSCCRNPLSVLDVGNLKKLVDLSCIQTGLTTLDITRNRQLGQLFCRGNRLVTLDVSRNKRLQVLCCEANELTMLNVGRNPWLSCLLCEKNRLTELDLANTPDLRMLNCSNNRLAALDVSRNPRLHSLFCQGNGLSAEAMNRIYRDLSVWPQDNLGMIVVDKAMAGNEEVAKQKGWSVELRDKNECDDDRRVVYEEDDRFDEEEEVDPACGISLTTACADEETQVAFYLVGRGTATIDWADGTVETVVLSEKTWSSCLHTYHRPGIYRIEVGGHIRLKLLRCKSCGLTALDLSRCRNLRWLDCSDNALVALDLTQNTRLTGLLCNENKLRALDLSRNSELKHLLCHGNDLTELDLRMNRNLEYLWCYSNRFSVEVMNRIYDELPEKDTQGEKEVRVDKDIVGNYAVAEQKGWSVMEE